MLNLAKMSFKFNEKPEKSDEVLNNVFVIN